MLLQNRLQDGDDPRLANHDAFRPRKYLCVISDFDLHRVEHVVRVNVTEWEAKWFKKGGGRILPVAPLLLFVAIYVLEVEK